MIEDGSFFENKVLLTAIENCKKNGSDLHCWGLLSDGGVHSHNTHLYGILEMCKKEGLDRVYVHPFLDGRDTPPESAKDYVQELVDTIYYYDPEHIEVVWNFQDEYIDTAVKYVG